MRVVRSDKKLRVYDLDYTLLENTRKIGGGIWNKREGCWEFPLGAVPFILEQLPGIQIDSSAQEVFKHYTIGAEKVQGLINKKITPRKHAFLMEHQRMCRDIAQYKHKYALYLDTGTGKTLTAYSIIDDNRHIKWIVVCPKSIVKAAWMEDRDRFFPHLRVLPMSKNIKSEDYKAIADDWGVTYRTKSSREEMRGILMAHAEVVVINPESFKIDKMIADWPAEGLIVDESSIMRNMTSATTNAILDKARDMSKVYLLSGKPAPNNDIEYFPQMLAVNQALFGGSFYSFRARYFETVDYYGYNWQMKESMKAEFSRRLSMACVFVSKKECLDLPDELPPVHRIIELPKDIMKYYKEMERERVVMLEDKTISVQTKLASMMKLRQITSGFLIDTDNDSEVSSIHGEKIKELRAVLEELGDNKAIIWVNFKQEVHDIEALLTSMKKTYVTAYSGTKSTDDSIKAFKDNTAQFIVAHPKTLKYGVTFTGESMTKNCTYAIYYSMSYSFEDFYQSRDRIYRKGQNEGCTYIFLVAENTVDEDIYDAIVKKGDNALIMENLIRRSHKNGI